jgi:hypothetical protein
MDTNMIRALLLAVSLLHPHHKKHQQDLAQQQEIAALTQKAAGHVMVIRMTTKQIEENCPYVPQVYFDAMHRDLNKIALDKDITAPSFREDFDNLEDDFQSLVIAADTYYHRDKI